MTPPSDLGTGLHPSRSGVHTVDVTPCTVPHRSGCCGSTPPTCSCMGGEFIHVVDVHTVCWHGWRIHRSCEWGTGLSPLPLPVVRQRCFTCLTAEASIFIRGSSACMIRGWDLIMHTRTLLYAKLGCVHALGGSVLKGFFCLRGFYLLSAWVAGRLWLGRSPLLLLPAEDTVWLFLSCSQDASWWRWFDHSPEYLG